MTYEQKQDKIYGVVGQILHLLCEQQMSYNDSINVLDIAHSRLKDVADRELSILPIAKLIEAVPMYQTLDDATKRARIELTSKRLIAGCQGNAE